MGECDEDQRASKDQFVMTNLESSTAKATTTAAAEARVDEMPASLKIVPTIFPTSPPIEVMADRFWEVGTEFEAISIHVAPPETPLELLEELGPSPFERGGFPVIGFLATTYDKVSRYAAERAFPKLPHG